MKESRYNYYLKNEINNEYIAYNSRKNSLAILSENEYNSICYVRTTGKEIEDKSFLEALKWGGYMIEDEFDEISEIRFKMLKARFHTDSMSLTIAPTSDCNFRCIYCYEKDSIKHPPMSYSVQEEILNLIKRKIKTINKLFITWYGGEPLLCFDIIRSLSKRIIDICEENNVSFGAGIVTNGYLLNQNICKEFIELKINSIQITLDGNKEQHDIRRPLKNGEGSFDKIIHNLKSVRNVLPYKINIRVNVDKSNINQVEEIQKILQDNRINDIATPYLAMVKNINGCCADNSCYSSREFAPIYYNFEFQKSDDPDIKAYPVLKHNFCCADQINAFVIDADGRVYKCWDDIGIYDRSIGELKDLNNKKDASILMQYILYDPTEDKKCADCGILPICMGGCHSSRLQDIDRCYYAKEYLNVYLSEVVKRITKDKVS